MGGCHSFGEPQADAIVGVCQHRGMKTKKEEIKEIPTKALIDATLLEEISKANKICAFSGFDTPESKAICMSGIIARKS